MKRISNKEVKALVGESWQAFPWSVFNDILDAQLASCEAEAKAEKEAMVEEIESEISKYYTIASLTRVKLWWQAFKQRHGVL